MLGYSPGVIAISRAYRNDQQKIEPKLVRKRSVIVSEFCEDSTKSTLRHQATCTHTNRMNGHVVSERHPVLGPGYQIVEAPPTKSQLKNGTMAPNPEANKATTTVRIQKTVRLVPKSCEECRQRRGKPDGSNPPEARLRRTLSRTQSTQTELPPVVSRSIPSLERSPSAPLPELQCYHSDPMPILKRPGSSIGASWASRSRGSDSCSTGGGTPGSDTDSSFSIIAPTRDPSTEYPLSVILIGDSGTGKTCLVTRLSDHMFVEDHEVTVGIDFSIARFELLDGRPIRMQLWDTAGTEKFRAITNSYYRKAMGVVLVYDVTRRESLDNILNVWQQEVEKYAESDVILMLVGNKMDLDDDKTITTIVGSKVADQLGAWFFEVSAKENINIRSAFHAFAKDIIENVYLKRNPCLSFDAVPINLNRKPRTVKPDFCTC